MRLYTSYYYQLRNFPSNLVGLSTAIWPPGYIKLGEKDKRGVLCLDCPPLKPGEDCEGLCNGTCMPKHPNDCNFLATYFDQLMKIDFDKFMYKLQKLHDKICENEQLEDVDFAFIFYEAPTNPCSERDAVQKWFKFYEKEITEWHK